MEGLFRRPSGVYFARLGVPHRHRLTLGKIELIESTGSRVLAIARIVGSEILARWRRQFLELDRFGCSMDVLKISVGTPLLTMGGYLPLATAANACGIFEEDLLRSVAQGRLQGYYRVANLAGHHVDESVLERDRETGELIVPSADQLGPPEAQHSNHFGVLRFQDSKSFANALLALEASTCVLFEDPELGGRFFAPASPLVISRGDFQLAASEVEALRRTIALSLTPAQIAAAEKAADDARATATSAVAPIKPNASKPLSAAIDQFIKERGDGWAIDHGRRIRSACDLFVELVGDMRVSEVTRDELKNFKVNILPTVPSNENKIRLTHGTTCVRESIEAVKGIPWPPISEAERAKRMQWLSQLFAWMYEERWIDEDPSLGLGRVYQRSGAKKSEEKKRDQFAEQDLALIFSSTWHRTGRGALTAENTYREFAPFYYWLPLLGLYTGARINELCQLYLTDIQQTAGGVWFVSITEDEEKKKLKTTPSIRKVPIHKALIELGFIAWHARLISEGKSRLFPELKHDPVKGFSKPAVKWFSGYLKKLDIPRNGRKVFHSFRHGLTTQYQNDLKLLPVVVNQLAGWTRGPGMAQKVYGHDAEPDDLIADVNRVRFELPPIAPFDHDAGVQAVNDALRRKNRGQGSVEDK